MSHGSFLRSGDCRTLRLVLARGLVEVGTGLFYRGESLPRIHADLSWRAVRLAKYQLLTTISQKPILNHHIPAEALCLEQLTCAETLKSLGQILCHGQTRHASQALFQQLGIAFKIPLRILAFRRLNYFCGDQP